MLHADPDALVACHLDDYAAAWAQRLLRPVADLARREGEDDGAYRPRLKLLVEALKR